MLEVAASERPAFMQSLEIVSQELPAVLTCVAPFLLLALFLLQLCRSFREDAKPPAVPPSVPSVKKGIDLAKPKRP